MMPTTSSGRALVRRVDSLPTRVLADRIVTRLRQAERALGQAVTVNQVKLVADVAAAQEVLATRQRLGHEIIGHAHAIQIHALAKLGRETEFVKIAKGWGDWLFYGFASDPAPTIEPWVLIDLKAFRFHLIRDFSSKKRRIRWGEQHNRDNWTHFFWFAIESFLPDPPLLVAQSSPSAASPKDQATCCKHLPEYKMADGGCWICDHDRYRGLIS